MREVDGKILVYVTVSIYNLFTSEEEMEAKLDTAFEGELVLDSGDGILRPAVCKRLRPSGQRGGVEFHLASRRRPAYACPKRHERYVRLGLSRLV